MDTFEAIRTKLESREYSQKRVPADVKRKVLEAARLTASGMNYQEWKLVLVQEPARLRKLAEDSTTGQWVASTNFAVIVLTDPKYNFNTFDAGRVIQDMQLAAWNYGVSSRIFTGFNKELMQKDFGLPPNLSLTVVVGFGYPAKRVIGRKNRLPLNEIAFEDRYGQKLAL
jgi:nitroreductase